jgi:RNA polymerase sigma-B factor
VDRADQARVLLRRWHDDGDVAARSELAEQMLPLARSLARRYAGKGEPLEDLEQVASLGLLKAIDRFDVSRDVRFATFAVPTIAGELKRHFRDRGWMLRVPREIQELCARVVRAREALTRDLGRSPTVEEVAGALDTGVEQVLEALRAADAYRMMSLDEPLADGAGALEAIGGDDEGFALAEHRVMLSPGLAGLGDREREIVHVSRLIRRSIDAMRDSIEPVARAA